MTDKELDKEAENYFYEFTYDTPLRAFIRAYKLGHRDGQIYTLKETLNKI